MRRILWEGEATNLKTKRKISFKIPASLSFKGVERLRRNIEVNSLARPASWSDTKTSTPIKLDSIKGKAIDIIRADLSAEVHAPYAAHPDWNPWKANAYYTAVEERQRLLQDKETPTK